MCLTKTYIYIYICVCVCVEKMERLEMLGTIYKDFDQKEHDLFVDIGNMQTQCVAQKKNI